jgi:hypothetical protein
MRLFLLGMIIVTRGLVASAQQTQQEIADALRTAPPAKKGGIIATISGIPAQERQPILINAVIEEADRYRRELDQRRLAIREGKALPRAADEGEYLFQVLDTLAQHHNSAVVRPPVAFIGTGNRVMDAIADFGDQAIADVLVVASSRNDDAAGPAMLTLKKMLERSSVRYPLSTDSRRRIVGLASDSLRGTQTFAVVLPAVLLAVATGDPVLIQRVKVLASDDRAVRELGINDQGRIQGVRFTARTALAERGIVTGHT